MIAMVRWAVASIWREGLPLWILTGACLGTFTLALGLAAAVGLG